jgi:hypothetical protein
MGPYTVDKQDMQWAEMGDFVVGSGDIRDTREIQGLGFIEECQSRVATGFGDWKLKPEEGANLHVFKDRLNNKNTWREIGDSITFALTYDSFLSSLDFKVHVAPVSTTEVAVRIDFSDNIKRRLDPKLHNIKIIYNLTGEGPFIMR